MLLFSAHSRKVDFSMVKKALSADSLWSVVWKKRGVPRRLEELREGERESSVFEEQHYYVFWLKEFKSSFAVSESGVCLHVLGLQWVNEGSQRTKQS